MKNINKQVTKPHSQGQRSNLMIAPVQWTTTATPTSRTTTSATAARVILLSTVIVAISIIPTVMNGYDRNMMPGGGPFGWTGAKAAHVYSGCAPITPSSGSSVIAGSVTTSSPATASVTVTASCVATGQISLRFVFLTMFGAGAPSVNLTLDGITLNERADVILTLTSSVAATVPFHFKMLNTRVAITSAAAGPISLYAPVTMYGGASLSPGSTIEVSGTVVNIRGANADINFSFNMVTVSDLLLNANSRFLLRDNTVEILKTRVNYARHFLSGTLTLSAQSAIVLDGRNVIFIGNISQPTSVMNLQSLDISLLSLSGGSSLNISGTEIYLVNSTIQMCAFSDVVVGNTATITNASVLAVRDTSFLFDNVAFNWGDATPITIAGLRFSNGLTVDTESTVLTSNTSMRFHNVQNIYYVKTLLINKLRLESGVFNILNRSRVLVLGSAVAVEGVMSLSNASSPSFSLEVSDIALSGTGIKTVDGNATLLCAGSVYILREVTLLRNLYLRLFHVKGTVNIRNGATVQLTGVSVQVIDSKILKEIILTPLYLYDYSLLTKITVSQNAALLVGGADVTDRFDSAANAHTSRLLAQGGPGNIAAAYRPDAVTSMAAIGLLSVLPSDLTFGPYRLLQLPTAAAAVLALPAAATTTDVATSHAFVAARRIVIEFRNVSCVNMNAHLVFAKNTQLTAAVTSLLVVSGVIINATELTVTATSAVNVRHIFVTLLNGGSTMNISLAGQSQWLHAGHCMMLARCTIGPAGPAQQFLGPEPWYNRLYVRNSSLPHYEPLGLVSTSVDGGSRAFAEPMCGIITASISESIEPASTRSATLSVETLPTLTPVVLDPALTTIITTTTPTSSAATNTSTNSSSDPATTTPTVTFNATTFNATGVAPLVINVQNTAAPSIIAPNTGQSGTIVAAGGIGIVTGTEAAPLQILAIFTTMACPMQAAGDAQVMRKLLTPVDIPGTGRAAGLLGNLIVSVALACLYAAVFVIAARLLGSSDRARHVLRHPQAVPIVHQLLLPGAAFEAALLLYGNDDPTAAERAGGAVALVACIASVAAYPLLARRARAQHGPLPPAVIPRGPTISALPMPVAALLVPQHAWAADAVLRTARTFIVPMRLLGPATDMTTVTPATKSYPQEQQREEDTGGEKESARPSEIHQQPPAPSCVTPQEVLSTHSLLRVLLVCVVCAVRPRDAADCTAIQSVAAMICFSHALLVGGLRLYRLRAQTGLHATQSAVLGILCSVNAAASSAGGSGTAEEGTAVAVGRAATIILIMCSLLLTTAIIASFVIERQHRIFAALPATKRGGESDETKKEVDENDLDEDRALHSTSQQQQQQQQQIEALYRETENIGVFSAPTTSDFPEDFKSSAAEVQAVQDAVVAVVTEDAVDDFLSCEE